MIAREKLEDRKKKLTTHIGALAAEKLGCIERAEAISEEMRQIVVLLKVFDATLEDAVKDYDEHNSLVVELAVAKKDIETLVKVCNENEASKEDEDE